MSEPRPLPNLPEDPILAADSSMLTSKFGKEVINYFAGTRLNRYSFLRSDSRFVKSAVASPATRYVALADLNALIADPKRLALFTHADVQPLLGPEPFGDVESFDSTRRSPLVVFLGLLPPSPEVGHQQNGSGPEYLEFPTEKHGIVRGQPYFAVNVTPRAPYAEAATEFLQKAADQGLLPQTNVRAMALRPEDAAILAQARSIVDWNTRHTFCAGCGQPNLSVEAGYKRVCPPTDLSGGEVRDRADCPTRHGVSNICFPRTDPTMIAAVVSADGQRILLGRQAQWPPKWYSALAGFLEPGESIEEAVRREVWEESGVRVGRVVIHSSQPWPFPSNLMIGAIAQALPDGEAVELNDKELEDARWFTLDEVREALTVGTGSLHDMAREFDGNLRMPPAQAIANRLVTAVVDGYLSLPSKM